MLTRHELAERWKTTTRTVDRRRQDGLLPWLDLAAGTGKKPQVRFRLEDVQNFERRFLQHPGPDLREIKGGQDMGSRASRGRE